MTVSELIEYLKELPQNLGVVLNNDYSSNCPYTPARAPRAVSDLGKPYVLLE